MKIRAGFVSNSSSSSFIITADGLRDGKFILEMDMKKACPDGEIITNVEELNTYYSENWGIDLDTFDDCIVTKKQYKEHVKRLKNNKVLFIGLLEYGQEILLDSIKDTKTIKVEYDI